MKLALISDYLFVQSEDGSWYSSIPWDERFIRTFGDAVTRIVLVGRCQRADAGAHADAFKNMHKVDATYYDVHPMPDWNGLRFLFSLPQILRGLSGALRDCDGVILKLFYVQSVLAFGLNRLRHRRPTAALLVGDSATALTMRADMIRGGRLREVAARIVFGVNRHILGRVDVPATVSHQLREKYTRRDDVVVANESWMEEEHFHKRTPGPAQGNTVLFVGRLIPLKGLREMATALAQLREEGVPFRWVIVGDGPMRSELQGLIRELGIEDRVEFTGWVQPLSDELFRIYRRADLLCLPSYAEGLPLVLIEAMANGVPVVATRVNGTPEIVVHEETGLLVDPGQTEELAAAIKRLLTDNELRVRCVTNGYELAQKHTFSEQRGRFGRAVAERFSARKGASAR